MGFLDYVLLALVAGSVIAAWRCARRHGQCGNCHGQCENCRRDKT